MQTFKDAAKNAEHLWSFSKRNQKTIAYLMIFRANQETIGTNVFTLKTTNSFVLTSTLNCQ